MTNFVFYRCKLWKSWNISKSLDCNDRKVSEIKQNCVSFALDNMNLSCWNNILSTLRGTIAIIIAQFKAADMLVDFLKKNAPILPSYITESYSNSHLNEPLFFWSMIMTCCIFYDLKIPTTDCSKRWISLILMSTLKVWPAFGELRNLSKVFFKWRPDTSIITRNLKKNRIKTLMTCGNAFIFLVVFLSREITFFLSRSKLK